MANDSKKYFERAAQLTEPLRRGRGKKQPAEPQRKGRKAAQPKARAMTDEEFMRSRLEHKIKQLRQTAPGPVLPTRSYSRKKGRRGKSRETGGR